MKFAGFILTAAVMSTLGFSQNTTNCSTGNCNPTQVSQGDSSGATNKNSQSSASQAGNSTNSNASGITISPTTTTSTRVNQTTTGTVSGHSDSNSSASGNTSANQSSSSSGGNKLATGNNTNTISNGGNKSANSNTLQGGNQTTNASGGAGGQGGRSSSGASASGGNSLSGSTSAGGNASGGNASNSGGNVSLGGSTDNSSFKSIFIPPVVPETPASTLAVGNIIKETSACGPLQVAVKHQVTGVMAGLFHNSNVAQGHDDDLVPYLDENGNEVHYHQVPLDDGRDGYELYGSQVTQYTAIVGTGGGKSIAGGGGAGSGAWGQGGMGNTTSMQQLVTKIVVASCDAGTVLRVHIDPPVAPPAEIVYLPAPPPIVPDVQPAPKTVHHKKVFHGCPVVK